MLLSYSQLHGHHTAEKITSEFEEIVSRYKISSKLLEVVTDNGSNVEGLFINN